MKRVTLIMGALALVLGLSQCRKPNVPTINGIGETQHIIIKANNGNDGSKVNPTVSGAALNLSWEGNETITVSGGATGTLTHKSGTGATATFEGDITKTSEAGLVFSTGVATVNYENQAGTLEGLKSNIRLEGTSDYKPAGDYGTINMELPYAVLKLDLSALGTAEGDNTVAITGADENVSVSNVTNASDNPYFVAMPTNNTSTTYTFSGGGKTGKATWTLAANTFYTKTDGNGGSTGEAIVVAPTPKFSVSETKKVEFSKGNLYWDGSAFKFEANQWDYRTWAGKKSCIGGTVSTTGTPANNCGLFMWADADHAVTDDTDCSGDLFCATNFTVGDETGWFTLSNDEWNYLLGCDPEDWEKTSTDGRANAKDLCGWQTVAGVNGLVILPDGSEMSPSSITTVEQLAAAGAVFLPAAGFRNGTAVSYVSTHGFYWSRTPDYENTAYRMGFDEWDVYTNSFNCGRGSCIRLVR